MADNIEQKPDGAILFPTIPFGGNRVIGSCFVSFDISCSASGLSPSTSYTAELISIKRYDVNGLAVEDPMSPTRSSVAVTNTQGDFSSTLTYAPSISGSTLPPDNQSIQRITTQVINSAPYEFTNPSLSASRFYSAQGGSHIDQDENEWALYSNFRTSMIMRLRETSGGSVVTNVEVPLVMKVLYMLERDFVNGTSAQVIQDITCDFDTPLNETQSASAINTRVDNIISPYNKTTEREVIHLDNRLKSTE